MVKGTICRVHVALEQTIRQYLLLGADIHLIGQAWAHCGWVLEYHPWSSALSLMFKRF